MSVHHGTSFKSTGTLPGVSIDAIAFFCRIQMHYIAHHPLCQESAKMLQQNWPLSAHILQSIPIILHATHGTGNQVYFHL